MIEIPKRFLAATPEDWHETTAIRDLIDRYLFEFARYFPEGQAPILLGNSGAGKSRAAAAILNAVDKGSNGRVTTAWFSVSESLNRLLDYRDMKFSDGYYSIYNPILTSDLIVMDDFSTLRDSPRLKEYFWMIFENRYLNQRSTILTGNFYIDEYEENDFWHQMTRTFSVPFVRRIREVGKELTLIV